MQNDFGSVNSVETSLESMQFNSFLLEHAPSFHESHAMIRTRPIDPPLSFIAPHVASICFWTFK
jgi:hypothetical protein